jgi:hypothetical protein
MGFEQILTPCAFPFQISREHGPKYVICWHLPFVTQRGYNEFNEFTGLVNED